MIMEDTDDVNSPDFSLCSLESLLSVPMEFIFRESRAAQSGNSQRNFLFSRSEVESLLRVSMLAAELDAILSLVYEALERTQKCKVYRQWIEARNETVSPIDTNAIPYLRAILPILDVHAETAETALNHATSESFGISRIVNELLNCSTDLKKFAEQNWNIADQFDWAMAPGQINVLTNEKRAIAEIEEAVAERIHHVMDMTSSLPGGNSRMEAITHGSLIHDQTCGSSTEQPYTDNEITSFCSMAVLCDRFFSKSIVEVPQSNYVLPSNLLLKFRFL